jgi:hypothetical protein
MVPEMPDWALCTSIDLNTTIEFISWAGTSFRFGWALPRLPGARNCSPFIRVTTWGRPRMLTVAPSPALRWIWMPPMR